MQQTVFKQTLIYFGKNLRIFFNEKKYISILLSTCLMTLMIVAVAGSGMFQEYSATRKGAFALVCACIWIGIFNSIQSICKERGTIKEEKRNNGLNLLSYTLAHTLFDALVCLAETFLVTLIIFLLKKEALTGDSVSIARYFLTFFLVIFASDCFGLMASAFSANTEIAMTIMPFLLIIQLILSGFVFDLSGPMDFVSNLTISRWGMNAICITADVNQLYDPFDQEDLEKKAYAQKAFSDMKEQHLAEYSPKNLHLVRVWFVLSLIAVVCVLLTRVFLNTVELDRR